MSITFYLWSAAYVNYIRKDPGAPCSLTEALEYLQVDVLEDLIKNDSLAANQAPPKHKPHNLTVVAMEGCHSFIILDWARPLKDDMVSGKNVLLLLPWWGISFSVTVRTCHMKEDRWAVCLDDQRWQSGWGARLLPLARKPKISVMLRDCPTSWCLKQTDRL